MQPYPDARDRAKTLALNIIAHQGRAALFAILDKYTALGQVDAIPDDKLEAFTRECRSALYGKD